MDAVTIKNLTFSYENEPSPCIKGLDLTVREGEFLAVIGRNASGKSTLARLINGLISPLSGEIEVFGLKNTDKESLFEIRKTVGIVFQNPDNQMVASIVEDDVAFGTENIGLDRESMGDRIEFALKATGTDKFRESMASRLSGGQKQRVAIAGVLAVKPRILILDESTSMLDPRGREEVMEVVRRLNKEENMTVITITHYMDEVVDCDRVAVLIGGRIEKIGTPEEIFSDNDLLDKAGLELPIPMKIAQRLSKMGIPVPTPLKKEDLLESLLKLLKG